MGAGSLPLQGARREPDAGPEAGDPFAALAMLERISLMQAAAAVTRELPAFPRPPARRRHRHRKPSAAERAAVQAKKAAAVTAVAAVAATAVAVPVLAAGSGNVTATMGQDPRELDGDSYECTLSPVQMTAVDGSEAGNVRLRTHPGRLFLDVNKGGTPGRWNDAYLVEGVNPFGYDSTRCDSWGYGKSYQFPVSDAAAGPLHVGIVKMHTAAGFEGDAGFDIWVTASHGKAPSGAPWTSGHVTVTDMQHSRAATEIMVWLNSPGIWRSQYASLGRVRIGTRTWQVLYYAGHSARHPWNYIVFAAPKATSKSTTFTDRNLDLQPLIRFAAAHRWVVRNAEIQAVDAGFEWFRDPAGGTQVAAYSLGGVN